MLTLVAVLLIALIVYFFLRTFNVKSSKKEDKTSYHKYLESLDGKNFFCYNNKKDVKEALEIVVIPQLSPNIELIYLNGKHPESDYDAYFIGKILNDLSNYSKFPHLIKIRNGKAIDISVNNEFYNTIDQQKPLDTFINKMNTFFELL